MTQSAKPAARLPLPLPMVKREQGAEDAAHNQVRPKPQRYADRTWMPPRGTRRSMGKR